MKVLVGLVLLLIGCASKPAAKVAENRCYVYSGGPEIECSRGEYNCDHGKCYPEPNKAFNLKPTSDHFDKGWHDLEYIYVRMCKSNAYAAIYQDIDLKMPLPNPFLVENGSYSFYTTPDACVSVKAAMYFPAE